MTNLPSSAALAKREVDPRPSFKARVQARLVPPKTKPFLRWAGGKQRIMEQLLEFVPDEFTGYCEPFLGSGALFFELGLDLERIYLADANEELVLAFQQVRERPERVAHFLKRWPITKEKFLRVRKLDPFRLEKDRRAARMIYLMWTCFNGLYRVNAKGRFNVPFGSRLPKSLEFVCERLSAASKLLAGARIQAGQFDQVLDFAKAGDFVFLDPPYQRPVNGRLFDEYTVDGFDVERQERLADVWRELDARGCKLLMTNSGTKIIRDLYRDYNQTVLSSRRHICGDASLRRRAKEVVVTNY